MNRERVVAIVQARMGSTRLPGKVLRPLAGRAAILHLVDRLRQVRALDEIVIATTARDEDRALVERLTAEGIAVYAHEGDPNDLLTRFVAAGRRYQAGIVLMVCGDCPLFDPDTASRMIERLRAAPEADYVRIAPYSIEGGVACLRHAAYERMDAEGAQGPYREHATLSIMKAPERFRIVEIAPDPAFTSEADAHRFWLDTADDLRFLETIYERLYRPGRIVDLREVLALLRREPELRRINSHIVQKDPIRDSVYAPGGAP